MTDGPVLAGEARAGLERLLRSVLSRPPATPAALEQSLAGLMAAADDYRTAPDCAALPGAVVHLDGSRRGMQTACRSKWREPGKLAKTRDPAAVTCPPCRRSLLWRAVTGVTG